jgi:glucose dehydrogenase
MTLQGPDDKQYVIVSAGGFGIPGMSPLGDYIVAFRL